MKNEKKLTTVKIVFIIVFGIIFVANIVFYFTDVPSSVKFSSDILLFTVIFLLYASDIAGIIKKRKQKQKEGSVYDKKNALNDVKIISMKCFLISAAGIVFLGRSIVFYIIAFSSLITAIVCFILYQKAKGKEND